MIKFFLVFFFTTGCFFSIEVTAQAPFVIKGEITDSIGNALAFSNIQLLDSTKEKLLTYAITDTSGKYTLTIDQQNEYFLKASFIGFETQFQKIEIGNNNSELIFNFKLKESKETLDEVTINYDPSFAKVKNDTIIYNLDRALNGQEQNLKDVLEKLPGVEIDDNGKVKVNGRQVNKLLIDGDTFFNNQHQLATENITSEMVDGVTFFEKYKDFSDFEEFDGTSGTALNISIKDKFKNRITGSIESLGGYENSYSAHTNLFRFGGDLKLTFIGDLNNIGKEAITFNDFIELNSNITSYTKSNRSAVQQREINDDDIPVFLNSTDEVSRRKIVLGALNLNYKASDKFKISGFSILNETSQDQFFSTERFFIDQPELNQTERNDTNGDYLFGSSFINADYKLDSKTLFNYTLSYNPRQDDQNIFLNTSNSDGNTEFQQNIFNKGYSLGQQLSFVKNLKKNVLLSTSVLVDLKQNDNALNIIGSNEFLNLPFENSFSVIQNQLVKNNRYSVSGSLEKKKKKLTFNIGSNIDWIDQTFTNNSTNLTSEVFDHNLSREIRNVSLSASVNYKAFNWLSLNTALSYNNYHLNTFTFQNDINRILPKIGTTIKFNQTNQLTLSYGISNKFIELRNTIEGSLINNYLTLVNGTGFNANELFNKNNFNLVFFRINPLKGNTIFYTLNYVDQNNDITTNSQTNTEGFFNNDYFLNNLNTRLITSLDIQHKFAKSKISFNSQTTFFSLRNSNLIENTFNITELTQFKQRLGLASNYKQALNFKIGGEIILNNFENSIRENSINSTRLEPYLEFTGSHFENRLFWNLTSRVQYFDSNNNTTRTVFLFNPLVKWTSKSKKWVYQLQGRNIFNIESPEIIQNINRTIFFEERISSSLAGYIGIGLRYNF